MTKRNTEAEESIGESDSEELHTDMIDVSDLVRESQRVDAIPDGPELILAEAGPDNDRWISSEQAVTLGDWE